MSLPPHPPTGADLPKMPERVRVLFADQLNLARGKYVPLSEAKKGAARFCAGTYAVTYSRELVGAPGGTLLEGLPDFEAVFDPSALRPGWEPNTEIALADLKMHGQSFELCGRSALKRAIAGWTDLGYQPMVGVELEAFVFQRDAEGAWVPYDTPGATVYGTGPFCDPAGLMDVIWANAAACGLPIESMNAEFDTPQFELTLKFTDALKAADDVFLFRQMAREVLYRRGYLLCFLPKPVAGKSGNGMHLNFSLRDRSGANAFAQKAATSPVSPLAKPSESGLPKTMQDCVAGLLAHHEALAALVAPTVNSYDRLKPESLSGYWANWGVDHRSVSVRVSAEQGEGARIEYRVGDCAASPYVAIAAMLQAARLGVVEKLPLAPPETSDGLKTVNTTRHTPDSLADAIDALAADRKLSEAVGQLLVDNFIEIKRAEIGELAGKTPQEVFNYYAPFI
jgi:glutamine synthetase